MNSCPRIEFVCVGTELLTGKINTHTAALGQRLQSIGLEIAREHAVGDDERLMRETFSETFKRADVVICAGGLGPTFDDITREVWSKVLKRPLIMYKALVDEIRDKFRGRGMPMPPMNKRQGMVLRGAQTIPNEFGTAPGQYIWVDKKFVALLPGPGREFLPMIERIVIPQLRNLYPHDFSISKSFQIFGVPESKIDEMIRPWVARRQFMKQCRIIHGILASQMIITVKFTVHGKHEKDVLAVCDQLEEELKRILGHLIFGEGNESLESVIGSTMRKNQKSLSVAESCTGGLISKLLTDQPGSSDYFKEGVITYSNNSKHRRLGVPKTLLNRYGAVSSQVAKAMARGSLKTSGSDYALSVTGIAGPLGGSESKPVGLVYVGIAKKGHVRSHEFKFKGDRATIRLRSALMALDLLRREMRI